LSAERVAEARNRAEQIGRIRHEDSIGYRLMRERLRSLVGDPRVVRDYYANLVKNGAGLTMEERYGKDVPTLQCANPGRGIPDLQALVREYPEGESVLRRLGSGLSAERPVEGIAGSLDKAHRFVSAQCADHDSPVGNLDAQRREQARAACCSTTCSMSSSRPRTKPSSSPRRPRKAAISPTPTTTCRSTMS
jgi:predicted Zn-dependent protease